MSHLHLQSSLRSGFRLSTLALSVGMALVSTSGFALEALNDEGLAEATGEGVAILPQDFSLIMQGANNVNPTQADLNDRLKDTGYIRLIPVGPLTTASTNNATYGTTTGKADIYLYGMAISQSNKNYGTGRATADWSGRFGRTIDSWGSAINPWLLKVTTENDVPNFSATSPTDTGKGNVSYLTLEAPLYHADTDGNLTNGINSAINALTPAEKSAYNLKLGLWADIFVRDPKVAENLTATGTQFDLGGVNRANRLRLQAVWDGFSINGSDIKLFQTLGGAVTATNGMDSSYNNTLGIAGTLRFNSGDAQSLRATVTSDTAKRVVDTNWTNQAAGCGNNSIAFSDAACQFQFRTKNVTDTVSNLNWVVPELRSVLRLSTQETSNTNLLGTPAINGGSAPTFNSSDGLYLYNLNVNLVLGSLYQPLTVGVATDKRNITLELARIPKKESIYKRIYTDYSDTDATYLGSTCNIYKCGQDRVLGGVTYQGNTATHSSISIGSTEYNPVTNLLTAHSGEGALGISFGELSSYAQTGTFSQQRVLLEYQQRVARNRTGVFTDTYRLRDNIGGAAGATDDPFGHPSGSCDSGTWGGAVNCNRWINRQGNHTDWTYLTSVTGGVKVFGDVGGSYTLSEMYGTPMPGGVGASGSTNTPGAPFVSGLYDCPGGVAGANCNGSTGNGGGVFGAGVERIDATGNNRNWALNTTRGNTWFTAGTDQTSQENLIFREVVPAFANIPTTLTTSPTQAGANPSPLNNFGSAVIDGLLIQHLKITTKGL